MSDKKISKYRKIAPFVVIAASTLGVGWYKYDASVSPKLLLPPMVQMPEPNRLAVIWSSVSAGDEGWVKFTNPDGMSSFQSVTKKDGRYVGEMSGLRPGLNYQYELYNAGLFGRKVKVSGPHTYKSPPSRDGAKFRFLAFGDSGIGGNGQTIVAEMMAKQKPDVIIHTGDLVYPTGSPSDYPTHFYEPNATIIPTIPFMPSLGNHDVATDKGRPLLDNFILPSNGPEGIESERNYYFDFGNARFVALDTNLGVKQDAGRGVQSGAITHEEMKSVVAPWLKKVLTECDAKWKFVYFHQPFYTGSAHSAEGSAYVKEAFLDAIDACSVDIVFCGHNHLYERTAFMRGDKEVEDGKGTLYITTGAGGANRYPEGAKPPAYIKYSNDKVFSFTRVDVTKEAIELSQVDEDGNVLDSIKIQK